MKTDLKRETPGYAARAGEIDVVEMPPLRYLAIDGHGDPNTAPAYADAVASLYPLAYALKFLSKGLGRDYTVPPLEALWWAQDMAAFTTARDKSQWDWTLLNLVPDWLGEQQVEVAREKAARKQPPALDRVRLLELDEGACVQTLHLGSYDDEAPVLQRMHEVEIPSRGFAMAGRHHEIYLSDARRTAPEKLRTILRQPVRRNSVEAVDSAP